jgi:hypothetical protein
MRASVVCKVQAEADDRTEHRAFIARTQKMAATRQVKLNFISVIIKKQPLKEREEGHTNNMAGRHKRYGCPTGTLGNRQKPSCTMRYSEHLSVAIRLAV